ncbi:MAG: glycosyltransferase family 1 protein [Patescibacteria group bacterium]
MKVGLDVSSIIYGTGVSNYTLELLQHLPQEIVVPFGFSLRRRQDHFFPFPPTLMHYLWNKLHIVNVETLIGKIDVYHSSDWTQGPSRAKKVTTVHDLSPFLYPAETDPQIVAVHTARMKWVVKECDKIICVSNSTVGDLHRLFPQTVGRTIVIPEALADKYLTLKPQITKNANYVFAIGARQPRKNIDRLKKACENIHQKLIAVGEGSDIGYVSDQDLVNYLAGASAFVYPSLYEGFGLPILEAFHYKIPVACSNTSSLPEVAGDAAAYFDPLSVESIAAGITRAIKDRERLIAAGSKQLAKFSWDNAAQETLKVYQSLC